MTEHSPAMIFWWWTCKMFQWIFILWGRSLCLTHVWVNMNSQFVFLTSKPWILSLCPWYKIYFSGHLTVVDSLTVLIALSLSLTTGFLVVSSTLHRFNYSIRRQHSAENTREKEHVTTTISVNMKYHTLLLSYVVKTRQPCKPNPSKSVAKTNAR